MTTILKIFQVAVIFLCPLLLLSQTTSSFTVHDQMTGEAISDITYEYGTQKGTSNTEGRIIFVFIAGQRMQCSHLSYGSWALDAVALQEALQTGQLFREKEYYGLQPVSVIALRPKYRETEKLDLHFQDKMAHDGGALLNQSPGFSSIRKSGAYGFDPVFRGFKYDQLNLVIDGAQTASAACPNRMDPPASQMAPNMLDRIEILKGPHALRYGTGLGATINFIPSAPHHPASREWYGRWTGGYESNGSIKRTEAVIGIRNDVVDVSLLGSFSDGTDYKDGDGRVVPSDFTRSSYGIRTGLRLSDDQNISISANRNLAKDVDFPALGMDLRNDDTWLVNLKHEIRFQDKKIKQWQTTAYGSWVDHLMDNGLKQLNPRMMDASTRAQTRNTGARTEAQWSVKQGRLYTGADIRNEEAEGTRTRTFLMGPNMGKSLFDSPWQDGRILRTSLFAEYQRPWNSWQWVLAGRLEFNQANLGEPAPEFTGQYQDTEPVQLNPSVSLGAVKTFGGQYSLGIWMARAQRSGSITERFINYFAVGSDPYELLGNPLIRPEVNYQMDLNFTWKTERSQIKTDLFAAFIHDYISSAIDSTLTPRIPTSPGVRRFINLSSAMKSGFELSWDYQWSHRLSHRASLSYTYGQDLERDEALPEIAPMEFRYMIKSTWWKDRLHITGSLRQSMTQNRISPEFGERKTPSFTLVDLTIHGAVTKNIHLSGAIYNLLDVSYYEHLSRAVTGPERLPIYSPGRNFVLSMNIDLM